MSLNRLAKRRDTPEQAIVESIRLSGCLVAFLSAPGLWDLLVVRKRDGKPFFIEVKSPGGKLTERQKKVFAEWGEFIPVHVVRTPAEALAVVTA